MSGSDAPPSGRADDESGGPAPVAAPAVWAAGRRRLTLGLVLTITLVAFESLAIATVMPTVKDDLGGLALYGWVFSGFFLASLVGIVVAGWLVDRRGPAVALAAGLVPFAVGLVVGGTAASMAGLIAGRVAQGFGAGTIVTTAYAAIGPGYQAEERPRMFAVFSSAWVVPALVGPAVATVVEHAWSWRLVFLGLLPLVVLAATMALPPLAALGRVDPEVAEPGTADLARVARAVVLALGVGAVFIAVDAQAVAVTVGLVVGAVPAVLWALVGLVPSGTLRLRPGVPATIGVRGILTCAFFAADAYVPLAVVDGRGASTWVGGAALTASSVAWAAGAWIQARAFGRVGPRWLDRTGFAALTVAVVVMIAVAQGLPTAMAVPGWGIAGLGMGLAYAPLAVVVLEAAHPDQQGEASASLQLSDALGVAVGTAIGGWVIATADARGASVASGTTIVFAIALVVALSGLLAAGRLPGRLPVTRSLS